jgi:hypothetical protein
MGEHSWARVIAGPSVLEVPPPVTPRPSTGPHSAKIPPCPPTPSPTYERLRDTIAKRMRMSHVDQTLMLMELLGHGLARQQPARLPRRTWPAGSWGKT